MRIRLMLRVVLAVCGFAYEAVSMAETHDQTPDFQDAKKQFLRNMKTDQPDLRVKAVQQLSQLPHRSAAELLIKRGFADQDAGVRRQALNGLRLMASTSEVREYLTDELKKSLSKPTSNHFSVEFIRSLAATSDEGQQSEFLNYLNDYIDSPKFNLRILLTAIEEEGATGDADSVRSLALLARAQVFAKHFGYRRSVVEALTRIRRREAVDVLVELIGRTDGLDQYDAIQYLTKLTKQRYRDDHRSWAKWWAENREQFNIPGLDAELPEIEVEDGSDRLYKNPIHAKRVVFVLNTSSRMSATTLESMKLDLMRTVGSLPESVHFNIVMYNRSAETYRPRLVPATYRAKETAVEFIRDAGAENCPQPDVGLTAAYQYDTEAIYFHAVHPPSLNIVNAITESNRIRRVSIHTIGVNVYQHDAYTLPLILRSLAEQNYGTFQPAH